MLRRTTACAVICCLSGATWAQDAPPAAERLPGVPDSLMLDVLRTPEGRLVAVGERGHVMSSSNGEEWTQAERVPTRSTLTAVAASGNDLWAGGHDTVILHSADAGVTWSLQFFDPERRQPIMDLLFVDSRTGFAVGAYGLMLRTNDGGERWEEVMVSEDGWHLNGIVRLDDGRLVITGESGYSYYSVDGGDNWTIVDMPYPGSMFGAVRAGPCVVAYGLRGNVQRSCDGGEAWEELSTPTEASLAGAAYREGMLVLAGNSGQVLVRGEDGRFRASIHPSGVDFAAVVPLEDGRWLLVGEGGTHLFPAGEGG